MANEKSLEVVVRGQNVSQWETDAAGLATMNGLRQAGFNNVNMRNYMPERFAPADAPPKLTEDDGPNEVPSMLNIMRQSRPDLFETPVTVEFAPLLETDYHSTQMRYAQELANEGRDATSILEHLAPAEASVWAVHRMTGQAPSPAAQGHLQHTRQIFNEDPTIGRMDTRDAEGSTVSEKEPGKHYITSDDLVNAHAVGMRWDEKLGAFVVTEITEAARLDVYDEEKDRHYEVRQDNKGMFYQKEQ